MKNNNLLISKMMKRILLMFLFAFLGVLSLVASESTLQKSIAEFENNLFNVPFFSEVKNEKVVEEMLFFAAPNNDDCSGARELTSNAGFDCEITTAVSFIDATLSAQQKPICAPNITKDVWLKFVATASEHVLKFDKTNPTTGAWSVRGVLYPGGVDCTTLGTPSCFDLSENKNNFTFTKLRSGQVYYVRLGVSKLTDDHQFLACLSSKPKALFVSPSGGMYSVEELVKDVLITANCDLVSNVKYQVGDGSPATKSVNTLGYFNKNNSIFPFEEGIVLSTSEVQYVPGPYNTNFKGDNTHRWNGDTDINDAIADAGGGPRLDKRVTQLEFDFIPVKETINFEYLFTSNSYISGCTYTCKNGALFAAWLIDTTTGIGANLAKIPGTNTPISMSTIWDSQKIAGTNCNINTNWFWKSYSTVGGSDPAEAPINFAGLTMNMISETVTVVPGRKYHIKLAVMDFCPTPSHSSAVFFKAGSFDIGNPSLGGDLVVENNNALCPGQTIEIGTDLDSKDYIIQWTKDGIDIPGENGDKLIVKERGSYGAKLNYKNVVCYSELKPIKIEYYDEIVIEKNPKNLSVCKSNGATTDFDLDEAMVGVTHNQVEFSYYESRNDAETATRAVFSEYQLDNSLGLKTLWVRIQQLNDEGNDYTPCYKVLEFTISTRICKIDLPQLEAMRICNLPGESFPLTDYDEVVTNGNLTDYVVKYYNKEGDARIDNNVIVNASVYNGVHHEIIWVRVERVNDPDFFEVTSFELIRDKVPVANKNVTDLKVCVSSKNETKALFNLRDKDNEVKQSASNVQVDYYETEGDAKLGDRTRRLSKIGYESADGKVIYARVYSLVSECFATTSFTLKFNAAPQLSNTYGYEYSLCNDSGYASFNLNDIASKLIGRESWNYTFYKNSLEAESESNPIVTNNGYYTNITPFKQFVYIRVVDEMGCFTIQRIELNVHAAPKTTKPKVYEECDVHGNGVFDFDLTSKENEILGKLNADDYKVTYYVDALAADNAEKTKEIQDPSFFSNGISNDVYVRVEDKKTGCYTIEILRLKVNTLPKVATTIPDYVLCDSKEGSGKAIFDLSTRRLDISTDLGVVITFHKTVDDVVSGVVLNDKNYENEEAYMQTVFVKISNEKTKCFVVKTLNLIVNEYPLFDMQNGGVATVCTTSNSGIGTFNLLEVGLKNVPDPDNVSLRFFESLDNANKNVKEIKSPETYSNVNVQIGSVWIRIQDNRTKCVGIYEIKLKVVKAPVITNNIPNIIICDNLEDLYDGLATYDLTIHEAIILRDTDKNRTYRIEYYNTLKDLENASNKISTPKSYNAASIKETIWVRLVDVESGCEVYDSFEIAANTGIKLILPPDMIKCSNLSLGQNKAVFDLTTHKNFIVGGIPVFGTKYSYYESEDDALKGTNAINVALLTNYRNKEAVQSVWIVVENEFGCRSLTVQTIIVYATPEPNYTPESIEICENEEGKEIGTFNLFSSISDISKGDTTLSLKFYLNKSDAEVGGGNGLVPPNNNGDLIYIGKSKTLYVRVENSLVEGGIACYVIVELKLVVNKLPYIKNIKPYVHCLDEKVEFMEFDLESKNSEVLDGRRGGDYLVTYHKYFEDASKKNNRDDALLGKDKLAYSYTNETRFSEFVWIRLEDLKTGCVNVRKLLLQIEDKVEAFPVVGKEYCDDNDIATVVINNGSTRIDLTEYSADIIGNVDNAGDLMVTYYASEGDYISGIPIATPNEFVNSSSQQTIIAIVKNKSKDLYCEARIEFIITVHKLPEVLPIEGGYLCTDLTTNVVTPVLIDSRLDATLYEFVWLFNDAEIQGATLPYYEAMKAGKYTITTIDKATGCPSFNSADAIVTVIDPFTIIIEEDLGGRDQISDTGSQTIVVRVEEKEGKFPAGVYEYALNDGAYQDSNVFHNVEAGDHLVWVRDRITGACAVSKVVSIMNYPKFFTPNGDGFNDTWNVLGLKNQPNAKVYIFDRSGKLLKQLSPLGEGWDGTYGGRPMPSTDYWFSVEYVDFNGYGREFKGHFSLKR